MHHIRLKRAQTLCKDVSIADYHRVLSDSKFEESEIQEFLELTKANVSESPDKKEDEIKQPEKTSKSKMSLKELETPEGWAKYKELALETVAYLMCPHLKIQVTRVIGFRHDAMLNKEQFISHIQLDKEKAIGETHISPIMAETLNSQIDGNGGSMVYYVQKSIVC